jgi:hypothetical protein
MTITNQLDYNGNNALHKAVPDIFFHRAENSYRFITQLLWEGCDAHLQNQMGITPCDLLQTMLEELNEAKIAGGPDATEINYKCVHLTNILNLFI